MKPSKSGQAYNSQPATSLGHLSVLPMEVITHHIIPEIFRQGDERSFYQASRSTYICTNNSARYLLAVDLKYPLETNRILGGSGTYKPRVTEPKTLESARKFLSSISAQHPHDLAVRAATKRNYLAAIDFYQKAMALPDAGPQATTDWLRACLNWGSPDQVLLALPEKSTWPISNNDVYIHLPLKRIGRMEIYYDYVIELAQRKNADVTQLAWVIPSFSPMMYHSTLPHEKSLKAGILLFEEFLTRPNAKKPRVTEMLANFYLQVGRSEDAKTLISQFLDEELDQTSLYFRNLVKIGKTLGL